MDGFQLDATSNCLWAWTQLPSLSFGVFRGTLQCPCFFSESRQARRNDRVGTLLTLTRSLKVFEINRFRDACKPISPLYLFCSESVSYR
jgi:hypothetical protein